MKIRKNEGLVGGVIFIVAAALALMLSGCDDTQRLWEQSRALRRAEAFAECAKFCGARPVEVRFKDEDYLSVCRCDVVIPTDVAVE
jgi:hypothetical protein